MESLTRMTSCASKTSMDGNSKDRKRDSLDDGREEDTSLPAEELLVVLPIEDSLDLHTFSPKEIRPLVEEYLHQCQLREFREVRIIHGRGTGTQRSIVRSLLAKNACVAEFKDAPPESGGWGATTVVSLKPKEPSAVEGSYGRGDVMRPVLGQVVDSAFGLRGRARGRRRRLSSTPG